MDGKFKQGDKKKGGRKKGTPNKFTTLKGDFLAVHDKLGGVKGLHKWATDKKRPGNLGLFYKMLATMLPKNVVINPSDYANDLMNKLETEHPELAKVLGKVIAEMEG